MAEKQNVVVEESAVAPQQATAAPITSGQPSALDDILARTDPRLGMVYRSNGFPDLPKYVSELGAGVIEGVSLGFLKAPGEPETTPEALLRGAGRMLGSAFIPLGPVVRGAAAAGISKPLAGAAANVLATEIQTRGEADTARLILDGAFGAIFGKFYPTARGPAAKPSTVVVKEAGGRMRVPPTMASSTTRSIKQLSRFHADPEVREYGKRLQRFWDSVDENEIDVGALKKVWEDSKTGVGATKPIGMERGLDELLAETASEPLLSQVQTGVTPFSKLRPPKFVMADVQTKSGGRIRAFTDIFEPATKARRAASDEIGLVGKEVSENLRGIKRGKMQTMLQWLKTPAAQRDSAAAALGLSADDQTRALGVSSSIGRLWERNFGESFDDYLTNMLPRLENASPQQLEVLRNHRTAGQMLQYAAGAELRLNTKDLGNFAAGHIRALSMMHHFDPTYKKIAGLTRGDLPVEFRKYLGDWVEGLRGTNASFAKALNPMYKKLWSSVGVDATDADVRNVLGTYVSLTHAGLLGFRPAPLIRNMTNLLQTGPRIGLNWTWKGLKKALTKEGKALASDAGMLESEVLHEVTGLRELGQQSRVARFAENVAEKSLSPYGKIDDLNRSAMFNGMHMRFLDAAKKAGRSEELLKKRAGLYRFHPVIREHVLDAWRAGKVKEAAKLAGVHAAQDTQWVYQSGFRPTAMSGELNKAFLQFGVWPTNYLEYVRQMVKPLVGLDPNTPKVEAAKWMGEWMLGNAAIVAAFTGAGAAVGLGPEALHHTLKWTGVGPLAYSGGPLMDVLMSVEGWQPTASEGAAREARHSAMQAVTGAIPGLGLARDVARAKGGGAEALQGMLGEGGMAAGGLAFPSARPSESAEEELFRFMTGVGRKER